jgi:hypothetical protein
MLVLVFQLQEKAISLSGSDSGPVFELISEVASILSVTFTTSEQNLIAQSFAYCRRLVAPTIVGKISERMTCVHATMLIAYLYHHAPENVQTSLALDLPIHSWSKTSFFVVHYLAIGHYRAISNVCKALPELDNELFQLQGSMEVYLKTFALVYMQATPNEAETFSTDRGSRTRFLDHARLRRYFDRQHKVSNNNVGLSLMDSLTLSTLMTSAAAGFGRRWIWCCCEDTCSSHRE